MGIAVDGTSLTVCEVNHVEKWFNLMLISHTQQCIIIPKKKVGERVNLEADCLGKYAAAATTGLSARTSALEKRLKMTELLTVASLCLAGVALATLRKK